MKTQTYPILDAIAAIYAAEEYQTKLAHDVNSNWSNAGHKPSTDVIVNSKTKMVKTEFGETLESVQLPSIKEYAKKTLGSTNKYITVDACAVLVTNEHREAAKAGKEIITNKVLMAVLDGTGVNGFIGSLSKLLERDEVTDRDIGLLTYVPRTARQYAEAAKLDEKKTSFMQSKPLGVVGDTVSATVTIFNSREMSQYGSILYEGNDDAGNLITFFKNMGGKNQFEVDGTYKINGRIKGINSTKFSFGAIVNTLNYVRITK